MTATVARAAAGAALGETCLRASAEPDAERTCCGAGAAAAHVAVVHAGIAVMQDARSEQPQPQHTSEDTKLTRGVSDKLVPDACLGDTVLPRAL